MGNGASNPAPGVAPTRWWQWVLLFPTLIISLITAVPQWIEVYSAMRADVTKEEYREGERLLDFMSAHPECVAAPFDWYEAIDALRVDGTICDNGNIFVRVEYAPAKTAYAFVDISDVVGERQAMAPAEPLDRRLAALAGVPVALLQQTAVVECQRIEGRIIVQHIRVGGQCFEERIDVYKRKTASRQEIRCSEICRSL